MNKKWKNSKKVGTKSGNINTIDSEVAIVTEGQQEEQRIFAEDMESAEKPSEQFEEDENVMSDSVIEDENVEEDSEADEEWELKKIMPIEAINHEFPVKCSHDTCTLVAATVWVSNQKPDEKWYSCLDCQVSLDAS